MMNRPLLDGYDRYCVDASIHFTDLGHWWCFSVANGCVCEIRGPLDAPEDAAVRFVLDEPVFLEIAACRLSPQKAFFTRRTDIQGNLFEGLKLAKLLSLFFQRHPYGGEE